MTSYNIETPQIFIQSNLYLKAIFGLKKNRPYMTGDFLIQVQNTYKERVTEGKIQNDLIRQIFAEN